MQMPPLTKEKDIWLPSLSVCLGLRESSRFPGDNVSAYKLHWEDILYATENQDVCIPTNPGIRHFPHTDTKHTVYECLMEAKTGRGTENKNRAG